MNKLKKVIYGEPKKSKKIQPYVIIDIHDKTELWSINKKQVWMFIIYKISRNLEVARSLFGIQQFIWNLAAQLHRNFEISQDLMIRRLFVYWYGAYDITHLWTFWLNNDAGQIIYCNTLFRKFLRCSFPQPIRSPNKIPLSKQIYKSTSQTANTLGPTSIRYRSNAKVSDRYLIDVDPRVCYLGCMENGKNPRRTFNEYCQ